MSSLVNCTRQRSYKSSRAECIRQRHVSFRYSPWSPLRRCIVWCCSVLLVSGIKSYISGCSSSCCGCTAVAQAEALIRLHSQLIQTQSWSRRSGAARGARTAALVQASPQMCGYRKAAGFRGDDITSMPQWSEWASRGWFLRCWTAP